MTRGRKIALIVVGALLVCVLVGGLLVALVLMSLDNEPEVPQNSVLVLKVEGALPDYVNEDPLTRLLGGESNSLSSLLLQLRKAKADKRVDAVPHKAGDAQAAGLIDGALYREQVEAELKKRLGYKEDERLRKVSTAEERRVTPQSPGPNQG